LQIVRGCELALFMPAKIGNLDCTLCGDCVRACPHDNIEFVGRVPGAELLDTRWRSGIGRITERRDLAALFGVFTVTGLLNAFAMTDAGASLSPVALTLLFVAALLVPVALVLLPRTPPGAPRSVRGLAYVYALTPLGVGIWSAHYLFHFLTGALTVVPVAQAATVDALGVAALGEPAWRLVGMAPGSVFPIQLGFLILGAVGSLGLVQAIAARDSPAHRWRASWPWLVSVALLALAAAWTLAQPMAMRGVR
jgi:ferredoxin